MPFKDGGGWKIAINIDEEDGSVKVTHWKRQKPTNVKMDQAEPFDYFEWCLILTFLNNGDKIGKKTAGSLPALFDSSFPPSCLEFKLNDLKFHSASNNNTASQEEIKNVLNNYFTYGPKPKPPATTTNTTLKKSNSSDKKEELSAKHVNNPPLGYKSLRKGSLRRLKYRTGSSNKSRKWKVKWYELYIPLSSDNDSLQHSSSNVDDSSLLVEFDKEGGKLESVYLVDDISIVDWKEKEKTENGAPLLKRRASSVATSVKRGQMQPSSLLPNIAIGLNRVQIAFKNQQKPSSSNRDSKKKSILPGILDSKFEKKVVKNVESLTFTLDEQDGPQLGDLKSWYSSILSESRDPSGIKHKKKNEMDKVCAMMNRATFRDSSWDVLDRKLGLHIESQDKLKEEWDTILFLQRDRENSWEKTFSTDNCNRDKDKNRNTDILPYERSRVAIRREGERKEAYINASMVKSSSNPSMGFIATQSPLNTTVGEFLRMIFQQSAGIIVDLSHPDDVEAGRAMSYLPNFNSESSDERSKVFAGIKIEILSETKHEGYTISQLLLTKGESVLNVKHFKFLGWPYGGVPDSDSLVSMLRKVIQEHRMLNLEKRKSKILEKPRVTISTPVVIEEQKIASKSSSQNSNDSSDIDPPKETKTRSGSRKILGKGLSKVWKSVSSEKNKETVTQIEEESNPPQISTSSIESTYYFDEESAPSYNDLQTIHVIHGSDGAGRTGSWIILFSIASQLDQAAHSVWLQTNQNYDAAALDGMSEAELKEGRSHRSTRRSVSAPHGMSLKDALVSSHVDATVNVNLMSLVDELRKQRRGMVSNFEQYKFCYSVVQKYLREVSDGLTQYGATGK
eukprot:TRINITY_DN7420_c0_g1_i3.p1 TRINITY_DN7420_c0_g1~~TRINITY_DN7420_c0_g1_i3.p1  ORF type:complete len:848 (-),score=229.01 TRINITY_DN7420_c0_g1_i3:120-2663(-)